MSPWNGIVTAEQTSLCSQRKYQASDRRRNEVRTHQVEGLLLIFVSYGNSIHIQYRCISAAGQATVLLDGLENSPRVITISLVPRQPPRKEERFYCFWTASKWLSPAKPKHDRINGPEHVFGVVASRSSGPKIFSLSYPVHGASYVPRSLDIPVSLRLVRRRSLRSEPI
jgi:hypothetical protein